MIGFLGFLLITDQVIPTSYSQSHLGAIDEWSSTEDVTLKSLLRQRTIERQQTLVQMICMDS